MSEQSPDSRAAARALSQTLADTADALTSDDLTTVAAAMTRVRADARALEASLMARGWGGDVLNGWGEPEDDEDDQDQRDDDEDDEDEDDEDDEDEDPGDRDESITPPSASRVTYQSRMDFYLVDEPALTNWIIRRAGELGLDGWDRDYVESHDPFYCFCDLTGLDRLDLTGTGLLPAGSQFVTHQIDRTLWEMQGEDDDASGDAFPVIG